MRRYIALIGTIGLLLFLAKTPGVAAQQKSNSGIEIAPAFMDINLEKPGEKKEVELTLTNHSSQTVSLRMFPIDFKQSDENGKLTFFSNNNGSFSYSLSSFLSFEADRLTLEPGEKRVFTIAILNRPDLSPGGHYAAVVAALIDEDASTDTKIAPAVSSLILLRKVGGERFNLSLKEVDWQHRFIMFSYPETIQLLFQNEGNIHMIPYGTVEVRDMFGRVTHKGIINTASTRIFPESRRLVDVTLKQVSPLLPVSLNKLVISGEDSLKKTHYSYGEYFIYVNALTAGISAGIIVLLFIVVPRFRKKHV